MRVVALHPDVLIATSAIWQTNCVLLRGSSEGDLPPEESAAVEEGSSESPKRPGSESFVVDSPILPEELDALSTLVEQAEFPTPSGLLATHGDWDHLLGRLAFPGLALGCAESTAARMRAKPGEAQRELRAFDEAHLIERPRPLALGAVQALSVPGRCGIGGHELELYPAAGHTEDGMVIWVPWGRVLLAGDYLSAVEIPVVGSLAGAGGSSIASATESSGGLNAYLATLDRLERLVQNAAHVVPGHGPILSSERALAVIQEDRAYLTALSAGRGETELPVGRRGPAQRVAHAENCARILRHTSTTA